MNEYYHAMGMIKAHEWVVENVPVVWRVVISIILFILLIVVEYYKEKNKK